MLCAVLLLTIGWVCIYAVLYINTCMFTLLKVQVRRGDHKQTSEHLCHQPRIDFSVVSLPTAASPHCHTVHTVAL